MSQAGIANVGSIPPPPGSITDLQGQDAITVPPNGSGIIFVRGATVAAGTTPFTTTGNAGTNTETWNIQLTQAIASTDATKVGLSAFNSAQFTVDVNGFVGLNGSGIGETITGNDGTVLSPTAGNWNIFGQGVVGSGVSTAGNIYTNGAGSTLTIHPTQAQFMTNYSTVTHGTSPYVVLNTDYYISCDPTGGTITISCPNAPTTNRLLIIKDRTGQAAVNNISITTGGGAVTIDGQTTYKITSNYGAINLLFNGTSYEVF
jgi:hypothetical protein